MRGCAIALTGDVRTIDAWIGGVRVGAWPRSSLALPAPSVQLNAEVAGVGDRINAALIPLRAVAAGRHLRAARCAFTTQGVFPALRGSALTFTGAYRVGGRASYVDLRSGDLEQHCSPDT